MNQLGFVVDTLAPSQLGYSLVREANAALLSGKYPGLDITCFIESWSVASLEPQFARMQVNELSNFQGVLIATSLATAKRVLEAPRASSKYFYIWDFEWTRKPIPYNELHSIYCAPSLQLLARSDDHAYVMDSNWNRAVKGIVEEFSMESLCNICFDQKPAKDFSISTK